MSLKSKSINMKRGRIEPLEHPLEKNMQEKMDKIFPLPIPSPNLFRILANNKSLFTDLIETKLVGRTGLFDNKRISPVLREKIILRVCAVTNNEYEFALHEELISIKMGLTKEEIQDLRLDEVNKDLWSAEDLILFKLIDKLCYHKEINDDLFKKVIQVFGKESTLEILFLVGMYNTVSMIVSFSNPDFDQYSKYFK